MKRRLLDHLRDGKVTKKDIIKNFGAGARPHMDELWDLVRSVCYPGKG